MSAFRALDRFDRRRPLGPWLHRIVVNRAIDWSRARALRPETGADALPEPRRARRGRGDWARRSWPRSPISGPSTAPSSSCGTCSATRRARSRDARPPARDGQLPPAPRPRRARLALEGAMTRDEIAPSSGRCAKPSPRRRSAARERARRTVLAAHARRGPAARVRRAAPLVWAALAATLAALVVTQRDSGPAQARRAARARHRSRRPRSPRRRRSRDLALPTAGGCSSPTTTGCTSSAAAASGRGSGATTTRRGHRAGSSSRRAPAARSPRSTRRRRGALDAAPGGGSAAALVAGRPAHRLPRRRRPADRLGQRRSTTCSRAATWRRSPRPGARASRARSRGRPPTARSPSRTPTPRRCCGRTEGGPVHHLAWSGDGRRLLIAGRRHGAIHDFATGRATKLELAADEELLAAAYGGNRLALAVRSAAGTESAPAAASCPPQAGSTSSSGRPDGRWLLAGGRPVADRPRLRPPARRLARRRAPLRRRRPHARLDAAELTTRAGAVDDPSAQRASASQRERAAVVGELDAGARDEVLHGRGGEDLPRRGARDARGDLQRRAG